MIDLPDDLVRTTVAREGDAGAAWTTALPGIVDRLLAAWDCEVDGAPTHGAVAVVVPVRRRGVAAVVKVSFPHPGNLGEPAGLRAFDGRGAARLLDADETVFALLLERAGPGTLGTLVPVDDAVEIAGILARRLAIPAPTSVPALADVTSEWREELDRPVSAVPGLLSAAVLDRARSTIRSLGQDTTATMLHGDLHPGNVLHAEREPWLAIDPKGWRGSAAYDAYTVVTAGVAELLAEPDVERTLVDRVRRFAREADVDVTLALDCVQARATSSALDEAIRGGPWVAALRQLAQLGV